MIRPPSWLPIGMNAGFFLVGAMLSWWITDLAHTAKASSLQASAEHERAEAFRWVASEQKRSAASMAAEDARATGEINHAREQTDRLLDCIEHGAGCGLRIKVARAPAKCGAVPEASASAGVGDRSVEWAELDGATRQDYRTLRDALKTRDEALKLCVGRWPG